MKNILLKNSSAIFIGFLICVVLVIFFPTLYAQYLYTDEANQLWNFKDGLNFGTSVPQGRYITYKIFELFYEFIHDIEGVTYSRIFSLAGWVLSLPIWYFIINRLVIENKHDRIVGMLSLIYIISMPSFAIYIGWAACMQMFIANTIGLLSGYALYKGIILEKEGVKVSSLSITIAVMFGLISLFTYQNGFGCFFIPFLINFVALKSFNKRIYVGVLLFVLIYVLYYLIFKSTLDSNSLEISSRGHLATNPLNKIFFFFTRPLATAFHFSWLANENSVLGIIVYIGVLLGFVAVSFISIKASRPSTWLAYIGGLLFFYFLIYFPSLIVKENYSSNRTLFALNLAVFITVALPLFGILKTNALKYFIAIVMASFFLLSSWYNYRCQFLKPLVIEYNLVKNYIDKNYVNGIKNIHFICPDENTFEKKFGIIRSWDEFGVPSTAKKWVPEPLIKQLVFEKTGSRQIADDIVITPWVSKQAFEQSGKTTTNEAMILDMQKMLLTYVK